MFGNAKPTASLSSGLLARKGQARPAMRPQGFIGFTNAPASDDLGWNDMGEDAPVPPVVQQQEALREEFAPAPEPAPEVAEPEPAASAAEAPKPSAPAPTPAPAPAPAPLDPVAVAQVAGLAAATRKGKAAFTLRLDRDRHLRLRLAAAVRHASAQALVTQALDAFLKTLPEVEELARQLPADPNPRGK